MSHQSTLSAVPVTRTNSASRAARCHPPALVRAPRGDRDVAVVAALLLSVGCGASTPSTTSGSGADPTAQAAAFDAGVARALTVTGDAAANTIDAPPPPPPPPSLITLRVVSAEIDGKMANGENWDDKSNKESSIPVSLPRYLALHPELSTTIDALGIPLDDPTVPESARTSVAADPMVFVEIGGNVFRSPPRPRSFNPVWDFAIHVVSAEQTADTSKFRDVVASTDLVRIHVVDFDGPERGDTIGSHVTTLQELSTKQVHTIGRFGGVRKLVLEVQAAPLAEPPPPTTLRLAVTGTAPWTDTGLNVVAGDTISIEAADEVCSKGSDVAYCSGPEGQRRVSSYNAKFFPKLGHAALIGTIGDTRFPVGRSLTFIAPSSGPLRLGINDRDLSDNSGAYAVFVSVTAAR